VVTKRRRSVTAARWPTVTHGSGHGVPISHRREPSLVYGYGARVWTGLMMWSDTEKVSQPASSPALASGTSSSGWAKVPEKQNLTSAWPRRRAGPSR
jgi:hypothetical protein